MLPQDGPRKWAFKLSPTEAISIGLVFDHLRKMKGKTIATIGISTSYGEGFLKTTEAIAAQRGLRILTSERYNPTDPSVTAQVLKLMAGNPDAIYTRPIVPWPAITPASSKDGTAIAPRSAAIRAQMASRSSVQRSYRMISPPSRRVFAILSPGASLGITMTAFMPSRRAAAATPWA